MPHACRELRVLMRSGDDWKNAQHTFQEVRAVRQGRLHQIPGHVQIAQFGAAAGGAPVGQDWRHNGYAWGSRIPGRQRTVSVADERKRPDRRLGIFAASGLRPRSDAPISQSAVEVRTQSQQA